jgi:hypothetical protein
MILNKLHQEIQQNRHAFDPNNKDDLDEFRFFIQNGKWRNICPFFLEWPYLTIPDMVKDKIAQNVLK